jgi:hypothetical protein
MSKTIRYLYRKKGPLGYFWSFFVFILGVLPFVLDLGDYPDDGSFKSYAYLKSLVDVFPSLIYFFSFLLLSIAFFNFYFIFLVNKKAKEGSFSLRFTDDFLEINRPFLGVKRVYFFAVKEIKVKNVNSIFFLICRYKNLSIDRFSLSHADIGEEGILEVEQTLKRLI